MTRRLSLMVAVACGMFAGAFAVSVLHAAAVQVPAYLVANVEQVNDPAQFAKYGSQVGKTEARYGGRTLAIGMPQDIDGSPLPRGRVVIIRFPSLKALHEWWDSPAYRAIRPLREHSTVSHLYVLTGTAAP